MIIDSHAHIFNNRIVENVCARSDMLRVLKLNAVEAAHRLSPGDLHTSLEFQAFDACLLLPSAGPESVVRENDRFIGFTKEFSRLKTLATLHPAMNGIDCEIERVFDLGIRGFKFSTFSQRFDPLSRDSSKMFELIQRFGMRMGFAPMVALDTFVSADRFFGAHRDHLTTPTVLAEITREFNDLAVVAAHMGGLSAEFDEIRRCLQPTHNLYLDTSNAAHTLTAQEFVELLKIHGPSRILFGTDWPWFDHGSEVNLIRALLVEAGFDESERAEVMGNNAARLLGLKR